MKVKAVELGYYGHRRRYPGDVFAIKNAQHFSKRWMESLDPVPVKEEEEAPSKKKSGKKVVEEAPAVAEEPMDADFAAEVQASEDEEVI